VLAQLTSVFNIYLKIANINLLARLRNECSLENDWQND